MRKLLFLSILATNLVAFALLTYPAYRELAAHEERAASLDRHLKEKAGEAARWEETRRSTELARVELDRLFGGEGRFFSRLRAALLEAEQGLNLRRGTVEYRPETSAPQGFRGYRIRTSLRGDFYSLYTYLERIAGLRAPLAPLEMTLVEESSRGEEQKLLLNLTWLALWPEESR